MWRRMRAPVQSSISFDLTSKSVTPLMVAAVFFFCLRHRVAGRRAAATNDYSLVKITPRICARWPSPAAGQIAGRVRALSSAAKPGTIKPFILARTRTHHANHQRVRPTETVVGCCVYASYVADPLDGPVPIGRAIANTNLHCSMRI